MRQITIPDWLKELPAKATLNSRDICGLFGYKHTRSGCCQHIQDGRLPEPSYMQKGISCSKKYQWYVKDVIKFINEKGATK